MKSTPGELQAVIARYLPYLVEIRKRLLFVFAVFFIGAAVGFMYFEQIIKAVMRFYDLKGLNIVFTSPFQFIDLSISSGMLVGMIIVFPILIYQVLSFLKPALKDKEYRMLLSSIPVSVLLFIIGFAFGSWMMKFVVSVFSQQSTHLQIQNLWDIENFLRKIFITAIFLGIFFQFPVIITSLIRLKAVPYKTIAGLRIPAYLLFVVLTMMMPPTDILSDIIIFFPLALLFELTLLLNVRYK